MTIWLACVVACRPDEAPEDGAPGEPPAEDTSETGGAVIPETADTGPAAPTGDTGGPPGVENVLFVLLDDVGTDQFALYDPPIPAAPTPVIDALAAEGTVFLRAWSMPQCAPTRAALLTGRYPGRTGLGTVAENGGPPLPDGELTLAELLRDAPAPWDTSLTGKWHLSPYDGPFTGPADQGFAWHSGPMGNLEPSPFDPYGYYRWEENDNGTLVHQTTYATTVTADDAIERIASMTEPWFMYAAFNAPHSPYETPPEALVPGPVADAPLAKYRAALTAVDLELGRVLDSLSPDVRARTTIVVMGDNGTDDELFPSQLGRLKGTVYEGGARVPLVVAGPRVGVPGSTSEALVDVVDWFPTVAEIAGVDLSQAPTAGPLDGVSLLPVLADPTATVREYAYSELYFDRDAMFTFAIRDAQYKLTVARNWPYLVGDDTRTELFDLLADPGETTDLSGSPAHAATLDRLTTEADALRSDMRADTP